MNKTVKALAEKKGGDMLINPYLKQIHPYYYRRLREAPFNATVILICGILGILIIVIATIIK